MPRGVAWPMLTAESGIDHYFKDIQRFPMLDPQEEYLDGLSLAICGWSLRSPGAGSSTSQMASRYHWPRL